jgi:hypothetical protein
MQTQKKRLRNRDNYASNASSKHLEVGELLSSGIFKNMIVYQECSVSYINPECLNNKLKVDWYIRNLNIAIEIHGAHHYKPTTYGGMALDEAAKKFRHQVKKDLVKISYLEKVNCPVIEINDDTELTEEWLLSQIKEVSQKVINQNSQKEIE